MIPGKVHRAIARSGPGQAQLAASFVQIVLLLVVVVVVVVARESAYNAQLSARHKNSASSSRTLALAPHNQFSHLLHFHGKVWREEG